jgi:hypothetical protein
MASSRLSVPTEIPGRVGHRLANERAGREVDDAVDLVTSEHFREAPAIGEAAALERSPLHRPFVALAHVVERLTGWWPTAARSFAV